MVCRALSGMSISQNPKRAATISCFLALKDFRKRYFLDRQEIMAARCRFVGMAIPDGARPTIMRFIFKCVISVVP
jgi:hypothetical protein